MPDDAVPLIPARILNEFSYCPRLAYLEWVQGEFKSSADTEDGAFKHRRVDRETGELPDAAGADPGEPIHARSVLLSSERLGLIARIDLVEGEGSAVTPVDYKRGRVPDLPERAWEPERVQVCAQALILRDHGYAVTEGVVYYVESKRRVSVPITPELEGRTLELLAELRGVASSGRIPPPLVNSPKCLRCSLAPICLPDEVHALGTEPPKDEPRRIFPARDDASPVHLQTQGLSVGVSGDVLEVREKKSVVREIRLIDVSQLCVYGGVQVSTPAVRELASRGIPVCWFSFGGWFQAMSVGMTHKNVELRRLQYSAASDRVRSLDIARRMTEGKIRNSRTLLRRNHPEAPSGDLAELGRLAEAAAGAASIETLLGLEGAAARTYFSKFGAMLSPEGGSAPTFDFSSRNRRPPTDPVNALLSFAYAMLAKELTVTAMAVGFDPFLGFYHQPRYGRPALALDLMEEFRPIVADSVVLTVVNKREVAERDFVRRGGAVALTDAGRKAVIKAFERRMDELVTHPHLGYQASYRRVLEVQARLLGRHLAGEIPEYPSFTTR